MKSNMLTEEEVVPLGEEVEVLQEPPPPPLEKQPKVDWKEKVACVGCQRLLSRHTLEFTHQCKGPKPEKPPRARTEPREQPREQPREPEPPPPSREQLIRTMIREEKQKREHAVNGPMRRFYGLA